MMQNYSSAGKDEVWDVFRRSLYAISTRGRYFGDSGSNMLLFSNPMDAEQLEMFLRDASHHVLALDLQHCPLSVDVSRIQLSYSFLLTSLKELRIFSRPEVDNGSGNFLKSLPSQLKSLCIEYEPLRQELDDVATYCKSLTQLEMEYADLNVEPFVTAVGPKLECLGVTENIAGTSPS